MVFTIKLTTAAAAAATAIAPICATAGGGAISPNTISYARRTAIVDLPRPLKHDPMTFLQDSMTNSPRYRSRGRCLDRAGHLLWQFRNICQTEREFRRKLLIDLKER